MTKNEEESSSENEFQFIKPLSRANSVNLKQRHDDNYGERLTGVISAVITVLLIVSLYLTHLIFVFLPWMNRGSKEEGEEKDYGFFGIIGIICLWTVMGLMTFTVLMGLWSFTMALITKNHVHQQKNENIVGSEDVNDNEGDKDLDLLEMNNKNNEDLLEMNKNNNDHQVLLKRWCRKCHHEKPPRTHHCSICNVCVLRMDHHCPWINNCVGYRNHGHYLRFLFYVTLGMVCGLVLMGCQLATFKGRYLYWGQHNGRFTIHLTEEMIQMTFLVVDLVGCGILSLLIGLLLTVQIVNVSQGHTTIESLEIRQCEREMRRRESDFELSSSVPCSFPFPFDLGFSSNFKAVFGENLWLWPFPLSITLNPLTGSSPDGFNFKTRPDALMSGQWPLPIKNKNKSNSLLLSRRGSLDDGGGFLVQNINYSLHNHTQISQNEIETEN